MLRQVPPDALYDVHRQTAAVPHTWPLIIKSHHICVETCNFDEVEGGYANSFKVMLERGTFVGDITAYAARKYKKDPRYVALVFYTQTDGTLETLDDARNAEECDLFNRVHIDALILVCTMETRNGLARACRDASQGPSRPAAPGADAGHLPVMESFFSGDLKCPLLSGVTRGKKRTLATFKDHIVQVPLEVSGPAACMPLITVTCVIVGVLQLWHVQLPERRVWQDHRRGHPNTRRLPRLHRVRDLDPATRRGKE
jgi:hypothetical protein